MGTACTSCHKSDSVVAPLTQVSNCHNHHRPPNELNSFNVMSSSTSNNNSININNTSAPVDQLSATTPTLVSDTNNANENNNVSNNVLTIPDDDNDMTLIADGSVVVSSGTFPSEEGCVALPFTIKFSECSNTLGDEEHIVEEGQNKSINNGNEDSSSALVNLYNIDVATNEGNADNNSSNHDDLPTPMGQTTYATMTFTNADLHDTSARLDLLLFPMMECKLIAGVAGGNNSSVSERFSFVEGSLGRSATCGGGGQKSQVCSISQLVRGVDCDGNKLLNEYAVLTTLGKGSFGKVKLAVDSTSNALVAIKILNKRNLEKSSRNIPLSPDADARGGRMVFNPLQLVHQEIEIMKKCRHPCLVKLINVIKDPNAPKLYLVMEFMEGGTLSKTPSLTMRSDSFPSIDIVRIRSYFLDVLYGLQFLHGKGVIHMDIKPENILVGKDGSCKLADFGVCTVLSDNFEADGGEREDVVHAKQGTPLYFAPEMLREGSFRGKATDVWALGVTMYVVVYGRLPFDGSTMSEYNENVATQDPVYYNTTSAITTEPEQHRLLTDVMRRMLCKDGSQRISVRDLVGHPFFNNMREDKVPLEWWVRCWKEQKVHQKPM